MENLFGTLIRNKHLMIMTALCVTAVGVGGWFLLQEEAPEAAILPEAPVQAEVSAPVADLPELLPEELPVAETLEAEPLIVEEEADMPLPTPPAPAPVIDNTPVVPAEPRLVVSPLNGTVLTVFAVDELVYSETFEDWRTHDGIDIAAAAGTTVLSASAGTVLSVVQDDMMGTTVVIDHGDGYQTTYANLQAKPTVEAGDSVSAGQIIGAVGTTAAAESAQGPHLHFSVACNGDAINPNDYLED